jgi:hypothetical protein
MEAQRASLAKRVEHKPFQRVGVTTEVPGPTLPPVVRAEPKQNNIGNVVPQLPKPLKWNNTEVVRSTGRNDNTYTDWRWGS